MKLTLLAILLILPACSMVNERDAPNRSTARFETGTRTVIGVTLFDTVGIGIFLPSKILTK